MSEENVRRMKAITMRVGVYDPETDELYYYETKADKSIIQSSNRSRSVFMSIAQDMALKLYDELPFARKE